MGTILAFPADAASRRPVAKIDGVPREAKGKRKATNNVVILPVVRIERQLEKPKRGRGPEQGAAAPGPKRRRR